MALFQSVKALQPKKHFFNLSHSKLFTCDMGQLIPCCLIECVPGDTFKISNECVIRFEPLVAPVLTDINVKFEYFFVPSRILVDTFEDFITGGKDGDYNVPLPTFRIFKNPKISIGIDSYKYTLVDYFGLPFENTSEPTSQYYTVLDLPFRAYNKIWNDYYRDETLDDEIGLNSNLSILRRRWKKDYFTSALPFRQRGLTPNLGIGSAGSGFTPITVDFTQPFQSTNNNSASMVYVNDSGDGSGFALSNASIDTRTDYTHKLYATSQFGSLNRYPYGIKTEDLASSLTIGTVSDLRLAFQVQKFLELNSRCGYRYNEFCLGNFGVSIADGRLQRAEYIGGSSAPILVSEVLQTSETTNSSPQGNLSGRGLSASVNHIASYHCPEFGYIIGLMSIVPKSGYAAQGINKMWSRQNRFDYYFPTFSHLSEQPIRNKELYLQWNDTLDNQNFGFQPIYEEYRHIQSQAVAGMRDTYDYWHLNRSFTSAPTLSSQFLEMNPSKRIFAVQNVPGIIANVGNIIKAYRPLPKFGDPGLIDHF